jgi:hypothetical protein
MVASGRSDPRQGDPRQIPASVASKCLAALSFGYTEGTADRLQYPPGSGDELLIPP